MATGSCRICQFNLKAPHHSAFPVKGSGIWPRQWKLWPEWEMECWTFTAIASNSIWLDVHRWSVVYDRALPHLYTEYPQFYVGYQPLSNIAWFLSMPVTTVLSLFSPRTICQSIHVAYLQHFPTFLPTLRALAMCLRVAPSHRAFLPSSWQQGCCSPGTHHGKDGALRSKFIVS